MTAKTLVMGIVNVTPDSFYDGGDVVAPDDAVARAIQMASDGADLIDIGGESSRPGAVPVSVEMECARVMPVLAALQSAGLRISVDTYHAETARQAIALGACLINDISAFRFDPELASVVAASRCEYVLMHMQGTPRTMQEAPRYTDVIDEIRAFFEERLTFATAQGIPESAIWLDPGFGFGKSVEHNLEILWRLAEFKVFGRPILIGVSNKATLGTILDNAPVHERVEGTAAAIAVAIANGADCVRVHDVKTMARIAKATDAIVRR